MHNASVVLIIALKCVVSFISIHCHAVISRPRYTKTTLYRDRVIRTMLMQCNVGRVPHSKRCISILATNTVADDYWLPLVFGHYWPQGAKLTYIYTHIRQLRKTELLSSFISWHIFGIMWMKSSKMTQSSRYHETRALIADRLRYHKPAMVRFNYLPAGFRCC